jgi:hypothetical protein
LKKQTIMKKQTIFFALLILVIQTGFTQTIALNNATGSALCVWENTVIKLGKIKKNQPVEAVFKVKNTGTTPLLIMDAKASCGCTVAKFPKDPILPGMTAEITATYNAAAVGPFNKTVTITTNSEAGVEILTITGEVVE